MAAWLGKATQSSEAAAPPRLAAALSALGCRLLRFCRCHPEERIPARPQRDGPDRLNACRDPAYGVRLCAPELREDAPGFLRQLQAAGVQASPAVLAPYCHHRDLPNMRLPEVWRRCF